MTGPRQGTGAGRFGRTWWGKAWIEALEQRAQLDPNRLPRGIAYARSGAVDDVVVGPGEVRARVEGRFSDPYEVRVRVRPFDDGQWARVLEAIAARAAHAAAMLDGQLPAEVSADVAEAGLSLLPGAGEIGPRCTCPDDADPCKHSAAVCYLVADALDADPFLALLLRGRTRDQVLAGLRSRHRDVHAPAVPRTGAGNGDDIELPVASEREGEASAAEIPPDEGVDARAVFAAIPATADIPAPPLPPGRPGHPAALPLDPPAHLGELRADLAALAADAVQRAWELAVGASHDAGLGLDPDADLARRAERALGTASFPRLSARCGVPERALARRALAWRHGGAGGFDVLRRTWNPATEGDAGTAHLLGYARAAVRDATGASTRVRHNRVTAAGVQLRLGRDYLWYPYRRIRRDWEPAGPPHHDPATAVGTLLPPENRAGRLGWAATYHAW